MLRYDYDTVLIEMFTAKLLQFQGPLDLLLYLVRKNELDILSIPVTKLLEQFNEYILTLQQIDVNLAGDFLATAGTLLEIKTAAAVALIDGTAGKEAEMLDSVPVPKQELVKQLLEYKKYCDAATVLQRRSERWQLRFPRLPDDLQGPPRSAFGMETAAIQEIELWDLVSAFGRILRENAPKAKHEVIYDETPIGVYMRTIHQQLCMKRRLAFRSLFKAGQHKSTMVGLFLASLELVRHEFANVYQEINFGEIELAHRQSTKTMDFAALNA
ncbi:MAG: segregation/condensation protein A [Planctomycetaceae bacterium]|jgi:segregation and condensation protein A|nr:segregation/condensation protein A [Planctomycetaceae bacterium]